MGNSKYTRLTEIKACGINADSPKKVKQNLLLKPECKLVFYSSQKNSKTKSAINLKDGLSKSLEGGSWSSAKFADFPHTFIFKTPEKSRLLNIVFSTEGIDQTLTWPDKIKVYGSSNRYSDFKDWQK